MKRFAKLATLSMAAVAAASIGVAAQPGEAAAGTVGSFKQPSSGAVSINSGTNDINVLVIGRKDADECTITATRKTGAGAPKTFTEKVQLTSRNQHTAVASFTGLLNKTDYTVSGTCTGPKATAPETTTPDATTPPATTVADETGTGGTSDKVTTNLLGGDNSVVVRVDNTVNTQYDGCMQMVQGIAWDLGLRGSLLQFVLTIAGTFCPR